MSVLFLKSIPPDPPQICEKPTLLWSMNVHPLNVIRGWSPQQHTTRYHCKKLLIQSTGESFETGILTLDVTSIRVNGNDTMECYDMHNIVSV